MPAMAAFLTIPSAFDLLHTGDVIAGTTLLQPGHDGAQSDKKRRVVRRHKLYLQLPQVCWDAVSISSYVSVQAFVRAFDCHWPHQLHYILGV